jgi:hypothetical protein
MIRRYLPLAAFLQVLAWQACAEPGATRIEGVNADVFRTLQYIKGRPNENWDEKQTTMLMRAIMKDQKFDDAEQAIIQAMSADNFSLELGAVKSTYYAPKDMTLKGALPPASRSPPRPRARLDRRRAKARSASSCARGTRAWPAWSTTPRPAYRTGLRLAPVC